MLNSSHVGREAGEDAPLRGFGAATTSERRAEAENRKVQLLAARPIIEAHVTEKAGSLIRKLTGDALPTYDEMLDIRAGLRALQGELRAVESNLELARVAVAGGDNDDR